jgi:hypothetical protein
MLQFEKKLTSTDIEIIAKVKRSIRKAKRRNKT